MVYDFGNLEPQLEALRPRLEAMVTPWIQDAWIAIVDPTQKTTVEDAVTGVVSSVTITPLWTGYSRVKPQRSDILVKKAVDSTTQKDVQFWPNDWVGDRTLPALRPGLEIVVMSCPNDTELEQYKYLVTGSLTSSRGWNRLIDAVVNNESRPNYDTSGWPQPPGA